jgi:hypothetical protein
MPFQIQRPRRPPSWLLFVPGGACLLLGILILLVPRLLVALFATSLMLIGLVLLSFAWRLRAGGRPDLDVRDRFSDWR